MPRYSRYKWPSDERSKTLNENKKASKKKVSKLLEAYEKKILGIQNKQDKFTINAFNAFSVEAFRERAKEVGLTIEEEISRVSSPVDTPDNLEVENIMNTNQKKEEKCSQSEEKKGLQSDENLKRKIDL